MFEVIRKNKIKSFFALSIMTVWYSVIYGIISAVAIAYLLHDSESTSTYSVDTIVVFLIFGIVLALIIFITRFCSIKNKPYEIGNFGLFEVNKDDYKMLHNVVEEIAIASGCRKIPKIYILNSEILNAYACGFSLKNSSIVVSKGLLEILSREELQGVIAHEMSHIINKDTTYLLCSGAIYMVSAGFSAFFKSGTNSRNKSSAIFLLLFLLSLLGQAICFLLFMFISRKREYLADACASLYTRYPKGLADALLKIEKHNRGTGQEIAKNATPLVGASFIVPLVKKDSVLSTHPSTQNRIKVLLNMNSADYMEYERVFQKLNNEKLIPKNTLKNSKKTEIKNVETPQLMAGVVSACALNSVVKDKKEIETIKNNKEVLNQNIKKHREVENLVRDLAGYVNINCGCGIKLKVPPVYKNQIVICPHCKKKHAVSMEK